MRLYARRLVAFMLDWVVLFIALAAPQFAIMTITGWWFLDQDSSNVLTWAWVGISVTLPSLAYFTLCDRSPGGMTVGKRIMGVAVRPAGGERMTWGQALARNIVKLIPWEATHIMIFFPEPFGSESLSAGKIALMTLSNVLFVAWLLAPLVDRPKFRGIHDRMAGTTVFSRGQTIPKRHIANGAIAN